MFEDLASALDSWADAVVQQLYGESTEPWIEDAEAFRGIARAIAAARVDESAVRSAVGEVLRGLSVSFLSVLDGATRLSANGRLYVVDEKGKRLGEGLHERFVEFLLDTGRMK